MPQLLSMKGVLSAGKRRQQNPWRDNQLDNRFSSKECQGGLSTGTTVNGDGSR